MIPGTNQTVIWKSDNRPSPDPDSLHLLALDFLDGVPYVATTPFGIFAYKKWNRPNPPYVFFKHVGEWKRISLEEFPEKFVINVVVPSLQHEPYKKKVMAENRDYGFVRSQTVAEINREPGRSKEYYSILRTPIDYGPARPEYKELVPTEKGFESSDMVELRRRNADRRKAREDVGDTKK
jgi:hypothetical protein